MEALFDILLKEGFWFAVIRSTTPILLTTLGAMIASRAGARNIALEGTSYKGKLLPHSYKIDKSIYNINKSSIFKYKFVKLKDQNILNYFFKLKDNHMENILTNMVKDKYVNLFFCSESVDFKFLTSSTDVFKK